MKRFNSVVLFLILLASGIYANVQTIVLQNESSNTLTVSNKSWQGFSLNINISEVVANITQTPWGNFTQLALPNFSGRNLEIGKANLPSINQLIDVPYGADVSVEVIAAESDEILLSTYGLTYPVLPYQGPIEKSEDAVKNHVFQMDNNYYSALNYHSLPLVEYNEIGNMRGHRLGQIVVNAVQYLATQNKIKVYKNIQIRVTFGNANIIQTESTHIKYQSPFFNTILKDKVLNYESIESDLTQYPVHYVVIYHDAFETALQPFIEWKEQKGFIVTAERISQIGNNPTAIKNYIDGLYVGIHPPSFVLLVGDKAQVETNTGQTSSHVTDLYYTTMTIGDWIPDLYIGRLSAQTEAQLTAQLDKILPYEKYQFPQTAFLNRGCFIATDDLYTIAEGSHNYVIDNHFIPNGLLYDKLYAITYGSTGQDVMNSLNAGRFIMNYSGHGSTTSWGGPSVSASMVNSSTNTDMYPFVISNACLTGSFEVSECFGETWVRKANGGGLAFTGASNSSYWDEDDEWERRAYDGTFWENYYSLAAFIFRGNLAVLNAGYSRAKYYFEVYHLFGDPSIMLYWGEASPMVVSCSPVIPLGSTDFTVDVTGEDSALVALYMDGELYGSSLTDANGNALIQFVNPPVTVGDMILTVTKFNRQPFIDTLQVIVPSFVSIQPDTVQINTPTIVNVTVMDADTLNPEPGVQIWAEGIGYVSDTTLSDSSGYAAVSVHYPFGPNLILKGKRPADNYFLFTDTLIVINGLPLDSSDLWVSTDFGLNNSFAKNLPGTLHKTSLSTGTDLYYSINNAEWISTSSDSITFTPEVTGNVTGVIAKTGYNIYSEDFSVILAYGYFSGLISDTSGTGLENVNIQVFDDTLLFGTATTNGSGEFTYPDSLPVSNYDIKLHHFGYLSIDTTLFVGYGQNHDSLTMNPAPSGQVSGIILEDGTTIPLEATVKFYRADNLQLYMQTTSDSLGNYTASLPFYSYKMVVSSMGYKSDISFIDVDSSSHIININLVPGVDDYVFDFEADDGEFTGTTSWEWGVPTSGPGSAYQGTKLWATNLTGEYGNNEHAELTSLALDLSGFNSPKLQFVHWYNIEDYSSNPALAWDGGNVKISTDGGNNFQIINPLGGYPCTVSNISSSVLSGQAAYSGVSSGWELAEFDLTAYADMTVIIKFDFGTDGSVTEPGWYIDSVSVTTEPIIPSAPVNLTVLNDEEIVVLSWNEATKNLLNENLNQLKLLIARNEELSLQKESENPSATSTITANPKATCFKVYKNTDGTSFILSDTVFDTICTDTTVSVGNTYYYYVTTAIGSLESDPSDTVSVTVQSAVGIFDESNQGIPTTFAMDQNYPNPFNPVTTIRYQLPKATNVYIAVYDMLGQKIKTLVNENQAAKYFSIQWNGLNEAGSKVASGIYLYRIEAGDFIKTNKMLLLK